MDIGTLIAIADRLIIAAVIFGVPVVLWRFHRRVRDLEHVRDAQNASAGLSEGRPHHPV